MSPNFSQFDVFSVAETTLGGICDVAGEFVDPQFDAWPFANAYFDNVDNVGGKPPSRIVHCVVPG